MRWCVGSSEKDNSELYPLDGETAPDFGDESLI